MNLDANIYARLGEIYDVLCRMQSDKTVAFEQSRPSVLFKPALFAIEPGADIWLSPWGGWLNVPAGMRWLAIYGTTANANKLDGVAGWGQTPDAAMRDFDKAFVR